MGGPAARVVAIGLTAAAVIAAGVAPLTPRLSWITPIPATWCATIPFVIAITGLHYRRGAINRRDWWLLPRPKERFAGSSSPAVSTYDPTLRYEEPVNRRCESPLILGDLDPPHAHLATRRAALTPPSGTKSPFRRERLRTLGRSARSSEELTLSETYHIDHF